MIIKKPYLSAGPWKEGFLGPQTCVYPHTHACDPGTEVQTRQNRGLAASPTVHPLGAWKPPRRDDLGHSTALPKETCLPSLHRQTWSERTVPTAIISYLPVSALGLAANMTLS